MNDYYREDRKDTWKEINKTFALNILDYCVKSFFYILWTIEILVDPKYYCWCWVTTATLAETKERSLVVCLFRRSELLYFLRVQWRKFFFFDWGSRFSRVFNGVSVWSLYYLCLKKSYISRFRHCGDHIHTKRKRRVNFFGTFDFHRVIDVTRLRHRVTSRVYIVSAVRFLGHTE